MSNTNNPLQPISKPKSEAPNQEPRIIEHGVEPGTWWRMVEGEPPDDPNLSSWRPGAVHLIQSVKSIKGTIHAVVIRAHPNDCKDQQTSTRTLLASDFFRTWVPAPDGDTVRARERAAIQARIEGAESAIAIERRTREIPKIGVDHHHREGSQALAHAQNTQKAIAERRERLLASAADIKAGIAALVPHQAEGLVRIQAQHEVAMQEVAESEAQIRLLALFTGTGVTVETWSQGTPAPPSEPLHVYQRTRYIDQESMYEAMIGEGEGADIADLEDFMHRLGRYPSLRRRICPAKRCIVALQARQWDRQYDDPLTAIERDRANKETFLLVRNGERLHTVHWDADTRERLLPRRDEWHRCFNKAKGWWDEENDTVGPDDIRFVDTWRKAERTMRRYLEAWIVIAGLHLRDDDLLGPITIPGAPPGTPANLLSHTVQTQLVVEIRDEEDALDTDLIPFGQLVQTQNARAHAGGRAVVIAHRIVREEERQRAWHAPRWWMDHDLPKLVATPKQELPIVCRIEAMGAGALGIRIATDRGDRRPIVLSAQSTDWLFLEGLDAQTLWRYARLRRREYAGVIPLAVPGALALEGEDEAITADARAAGLDPSARHVRQAVRALRATGATEKPTRRRSSQVRALAAWIERGPHAITEACAHTGITEPIAIHLKRDGSIQIWSGPPEIVAGLAWCETTNIRIGANGRILRARGEPGKAGITPGVVLHGMANESLGTLGTWERHECWTDLQTILEAMTVVPEGIEALAHKLRRNRADRQAMARGIGRMGATNQRRLVIAHGALWWPIAIVRDRMAKVEEPQLHTLMLRCNADEILAKLGGKAGLDAACEGLEERYAEPQTHVERARRDAEAPTHDVGTVVRVPIGAAKLDAQQIAQGNLPWYPDPKNRKEWPNHERKNTTRTRTHWWPSREGAQRESHGNARWEIVAEAPEGPWTSIPHFQ